MYDTGWKACLTAEHAGFSVCKEVVWRTKSPRVRSSVHESRNCVVGLRDGERDGNVHASKSSELIHDRRQRHRLKHRTFIHAFGSG